MHMDTKYYMHRIGSRLFVRTRDGELAPQMCLKTN
jgi:hypothetical protein